MGEYADEYIDRMIDYHSFDRYKRRRYKERDHKHMATKSKIIVIRGKAHWAKLLGKPRPYTGNPKYDKGPYWSVDITPLNDGEIAKLKAAGVPVTGRDSKLREPKGEKETRTEPYLRLTVLERNKDGELNPPPSIVDAQGNKWGEDLIGNESIVDVMLKVNDYGDTVGLYYQKLRVLKHVPYEGGGFAPLSEDDEFFAGGSVDDGVAPKGSTGPTGGSNGEDFEDDIPF